MDRVIFLTNGKTTQILDIHLDNHLVAKGELMFVSSLNDANSFVVTATDLPIAGHYITI